MLFAFNSKQNKIENSSGSAFVTTPLTISVAGPPYSLSSAFFYLRPQWSHIRSRILAVSLKSPLASRSTPALPSG